MTAFGNKVAAAKEALTATESDPGYKRAIWTLMIACGGATKRQPEPGDDGPWYPDVTDFYGGGRIETNLRLTREVLEELSEATIKWDECTDPSESHAAGFLGTFTNSTMDVPYLKGFLQLYNRKVYWAVTVGGDGDDFGRIVRCITALDLTLDDAIEELRYRLDNVLYGDESYFSYSCALPEL